MSSMPKTLREACEAVTPSTDQINEFVHESPTQTFEQAAAMMRELVTDEANSLAELDALCDALEPNQLDLQITDALQSLRATLAQGAAETSDLLAALGVLGSGSCESARSARAEPASGQATSAGA